MRWMGLGRGLAIVGMGWRDGCADRGGGRVGMRVGGGKVDGWM